MLPQLIVGKCHKSTLFVIVEVNEYLQSFLSHFQSFPRCFLFWWPFHIWSYWREIQKGSSFCLLVKTLTFLKQIELCEVSCFNFYFHNLTLKSVWKNSHSSIFRFLNILIFRTCEYKTQKRTIKSIFFPK